MRSLQFGGTAIEANNARMFNCAFTHMNRLEAFREAFFLLLSGTGVGFSVQKHHVAQLPAFPLRAAGERTAGGALTRCPIRSRGGPTR
jgi:ribonucleoside-triphosphate reductase (thioredoxin)